MDKNTLIGLILIGAVLLGFGWLNQPSPEQLAQQQQTTPPQPDTAVLATPVADTLATPDSVAQVSIPMYRQVRPAEVVTLRNAKVSIDISTHGGTPVQAVLADYLNQQKTPVRLFGPNDIRLNFPMRTLDNQLLNTADLHFTIQSQTDSTVVMRLPIAEGSHLDFSYTLLPDDYRVRFGISGQALESLLPANISLQDIEWSQRIPQQEQSHRFESQYSSIYYYTRGGDVDDLSSTSKDEETVKEALRWLAFKDKYFSSALINHSSAFEDSRLTVEAMPEDSGYVMSMAMRSSFPFTIRDGARADFTFFFGPNDYELLTGYDAGVSDTDKLHLDHLVYLGINVFRWINLYLIIPIVTFLKGFISNWGIIILLMTIAIKLLLSPFTFKSYMSQAKMRVLKPQVDEINKKYEGKTDQESMVKKQQETMALYSSAGASPLSGCLPMLLQMPFLIALYMYFPTSIFLRGESFLWAQDLSTYDPIISWDFNIPLISSLLGNHISLFCLLMTIVNIVYNRYMMAQSGGSGDAMPGMKYMPYMMSIMFFFMFNQNASGLSYYYFISTLITILQYFAFRFTLNEEKLLAQLEENKKKPKKKSRWMERLEEAQRQQREMQKQRERRGR